MKGSAKVIEVLNEALTAEITAINQYFIHAKMCENWGYLLLYEDGEKRAVEEMKHAEILIERILFLEGIPIITKLDKINVGSTVKEQAENDYGLEKIAIQRLQKAINLCIEEADGGSRELLEHILLDEEKHADDLETYLQQIKDMGIQNFLVTQVHKKEKS
ncbi:MAG: bacterioferritin [Planctomycetia bacterium]|uniref:Bacterioferritin n=1 Tax=Candidatus Brocadia sapporoensis TaxID=392547 RepID=A0A1V6M2Y4_9BACT|nr:bacterioferritin [Candidatus Brocadia sapporoensis]MCC7239594.1 bacterioferritin [Candidatus Brocadia sp.]QOJ05666.1 MAG: bacterioferritin [Planctomycetia bacterium]TVL96962.1 MAG: bacterioferritin [Candidatus Brocadia sp. BL1]MDG6006143.1 bacterioferritin [Candidatus Brocadia sp.]OQD46768.1 bacterioferritin [Candidatus Brocadia sapporoensis]